MLHLGSKAREGAEIGKERKPGEGWKGSGGTVRTTGEEHGLGSSAPAACRQGEIATITV